MVSSPTISPLKGDVFTTDLRAGVGSIYKSEIIAPYEDAEGEVTLDLEMMARCNRVYESEMIAPYEDAEGEVTLDLF